jgi:hypothetical protein
MQDPLYFRSPLHYYSNKTYDWIVSDTEERYKENLKKNKNLLVKHGWIDRKITYKFNSLGFRCDEFEQNRDCILFLGCSYTFGVGLPLETIWPTLVANKLKLKCYNLGIGGGSNDTAFRLGYHYIPMLKPKAVILLSPSADRVELMNKNNRFDQHGPWNINIFYKFWTQHDANGKINQIKNMLALKAICDSNGANFLNFDLDDFKVIDLARDLTHYGTKSHREFSKLVIKRLQGPAVNGTENLT